ncbi:MAG: c-type cytochrome [Nitrospinae bacterium]|nr:c-type cytochrome [Nitrospinota bacterium]MBL7019864.1 c-type cytochrome [Nitrospinaceae bacterium]
MKPTIKPGIPHRSGVTHLLLFCFLATSAPSWGFTPPPSEDLPKSFVYKDKSITLKNLTNPFKGNPKVVKKGGTLYTRHCFFCHGDLLDGNGLFGKSFFPPPADFTRLDSILSRPQAYTFWRIMKGGQGLPEKYEPWNSAMPAWEDALSEKDVWKIITYIYDTAGQRHAKPGKQEPPSLKRGKRVYLEKCAFCHGEEGKGDGPAADYSMPQPRNLTKGHIKIRSTPFGKIPTDKDLMNVIDNGLRSTTMPGWKHLPENDRKSLLVYIKSLSKKFAKFKKKGKKHKITKVGKEPALSPESMERGKALFMTQCSGCHGVEGRGDGVTTQRIVDYSSSAIWPRNLSQPWTFRRGSTRKDIFITLRTGLSTSAMPKFSEKVFKDEQIWDIVNFVTTLAPPTQPKMQSPIHAKKVAGEISDDPNDPIWQNAQASFIPLGGQLQEKPKSYFPTVRNLTVRAVHNKKEVSLYIHWDDPSLDPALIEFTDVEVSPPPPLPEHMRGKEPKEALEPASPEYPDAIAVQFPVSLDKQIPHFLNGDTDHPVNLWKWTTATNKATEIHANGLKGWAHQEDSAVRAKGHFSYGRYSVILKRVFKEDEGDIQFQTGKPIPIAFNVWDGYAEETGNKKSISSWFTLWLDE